MEIKPKLKDSQWKSNLRHLNYYSKLTTVFLFLKRYFIFIPILVILSLYSTTAYLSFFSQIDFNVVYDNLFRGNTEMDLLERDFNDDENIGGDSEFESELGLGGVTLSEFKNFIIGDSEKEKSDSNNLDQKKSTSKEENKTKNIDDEYVKNKELSLMPDTIFYESDKETEEDFFKFYYERYKNELFIVYKFFIYLGFLNIFSFFYNKFLYKHLFKIISKISKFDIQEVIYNFDYKSFNILVGKIYDDFSTNLKLRSRAALITGLGIFLNVLIIGGIGTGKTISAFQQFLVQTVYYNFDNAKLKACALILDVKGTFLPIAKKYLEEVNRLEDLIVLSVDQIDITINFLHKPNLSPLEIASRMKTVLKSFSSSGNNDEGYFLDKAETFLANLITILRLKDNYVTFETLHHATLDNDLRQSIIDELQLKYDSNQFNESDAYNFNNAKLYFKDEYFALSDKIRTTISSEVTRMTETFVSNNLFKKIFCPTKEEITFKGFESVLEEGKFFIFNVDANQEKKLAKIVAAFLKIDYEAEVLATMKYKDTPRENFRIKGMFCDECHMYVDDEDAEYLSLSRQALGFAVFATQHYSGLLKAFSNNESSFNQFTAACVNKIFFRTDDTAYTAKKIIEQIGEHEVQRASQSIGESSRKSKSDYAAVATFGQESNLSKTISYQTTKENIYDIAFFNRGLKEGQAVCLLSNGKGLEEPVVVHLPRQHIEGRIHYHDGKFHFVDFKPISIGNENLSILDRGIEDTIKRDINLAKVSGEIFKNAKNTIIKKPKREKELKVVVNLGDFDIEEESNNQNVSVSVNLPTSKDTSDKEKQKLDQETQTQKEKTKYEELSAKNVDNVIPFTKDGAQITEQQNERNNQHQNNETLKKEPPTSQKTPNKEIERVQNISFGIDDI